MRQINLIKLSRLGCTSSLRCTGCFKFNCPFWSANCSNSINFYYFDNFSTVNFDFMEGHKEIREASFRKIHLWINNRYPRRIVHDWLPVIYLRSLIALSNTNWISIVIVFTKWLVNNYRYWFWLSLRTSVGHQPGSGEFVWPVARVCTHFIWLWHV